MNGQIIVFDLNRYARCYSAGCDQQVSYKGLGIAKSFQFEGGVHLLCLSIAVKFGIGSIEVDQGLIKGLGK